MRRLKDLSQVLKRATISYVQSRLLRQTYCAPEAQQDELYGWTIRVGLKDGGKLKVRSEEVMTAGGEKEVGVVFFPTEIFGESTNEIPMELGA